MFSAMTFLGSLTADHPAVVNQSEPSNAPGSTESDALDPDGFQDGGFAPVADGGDGADLPIREHLNAADILVIDFIEGREPRLHPAWRLDSFGPMPIRLAGGEIYASRAGRLQAEARATGKLRPGETWAVEISENKADYPLAGIPDR